MKKQILFALLFAIVAMLAGLVNQALAQTIWAVGNTEVISPTDDIQRFNYIWSSASKQVSIKAARNEHEPFQLIITADGGSLRSVSVIVSDLADGGNTIAGENITLYREAFVNVIRKSQYSGHPSLGIIRVKPGALIPFNDPYGSDATPGVPFDVPSGENQPVWIDVYVPTGTPAGRYTGTVTVIEGNTTIDTITLIVTVWNFEIPVERHLKYVIYTFSEDLEGLAADVYGVNKIPDEVMENYYKALADRRMGVLRMHKRPAYDDATGFDWTDVEPLYNRFANQYNFPLLGMPPIYYDKRFEEDGDVWWEGEYAIKDPDGLPYATADFTEGSDFMIKAVQYYRRLYDDFSAKGWIDKHFAELNDESGHVSDEPYNIGEEGFRRVKLWSEILHSANSNIKFLVASESIVPSADYDDIRGYIDIWDMYADEIQVNAPSYRSHLAANPDEELWMVPNAYADFIDYPVIYPRTLGWFAYKYGATGIEEWSAFAWYDADQEPYDPWKLSPPPAAHFGLGAGALFYPGYNIENSGTSIDGPVSSIRMELNREALEDYEYLWLLEQQIGSSYGKSLADKIIPSQLFYGIPTTPEDFYSARELMGDILSNGMSAQTAALSGVVKDNRAEPIAGVLVSTGGAAGITGPDGAYSITVIPGKHIIKAASNRYTSSLQYINVEPNELRTGMDFILTFNPSESVLLFNSFEDTDDIWTENEGATTVRSSDYATDGSYSMKATIDENFDDAYVSIEFDSPQNWTEYASLGFDIYNDSVYGSLMEIVIYNSQWELVFEQSVTPLSPEALGHIDIPINASFGDVLALELHIDTAGQGDKDVYIDNIRLKLKAADPPGYALESPSNVQVTDVSEDQGHTLKVSWNVSPSEESGNVNWYRIYRSRNYSLTEPFSITQFDSQDLLVFYEKSYTILIDSVAVGVTEYTDSVPLSGVNYFYWIQAVGDSAVSEKAASFITTTVEQAPDTFSLSAPYPNPFNPRTTITYFLPKEAHVTLTIINVSGQTISVLKDEYQQAGNYILSWKAVDMPSGIYFCTLKADTFVDTKKMLLLK